jgi:hypothetical protein
VDIEIHGAEVYTIGTGVAVPPSPWERAGVRIVFGFWPLDDMVGCNGTEEKMMS